MQYLIIFRLAIPNEFVFPTHERLEHLVYQRGWQPIHRETCIEAGLIYAAESEAHLRHLLQSGLGEGETLDIIAAPEFRSHDQVVQWAKAHATHMNT